MFFPKKIFHAVEALLNIALNQSNHPLSGKALAQLQNLPPRYLEQMLQKLVHEGILRSLRGPRGGYVLGRERRRITLAEIITAIQAEEDIIASSNLIDKVVLPHFTQAQNVLLEPLAKITLSQLCDEAYTSGLLTNNTIKTADSFII